VNRTTWLLLLLAALLAGIAVPTQFAINSQLRQVVGGPVLAAALLRRSVPEPGPIVGAPRWMYLTVQQATTPRLLGALLVIAGVTLVQRF
jgi:bacterial/archaeal transporter family-2 protein